MFIVFGSKLCGRVDEVPGFFHVATTFVHLWYIPLVPMGSYLVIHRASTGGRTGELGFSFKSVLIAWLRAALTIFAVAPLTVGAIALLIGPSQVFTGQVSLVVVFATGMACLVAALVSCHYGPLRYATYERARGLAQLAGMTDEGLVKLELHFGRLTEQQADAALEAIAKDRAEMRALELEIAGRPSGAGAGARS